MKDNSLDGDTLVVWTSDNGAVRRQPRQGSNLPLGGWGYSTSEGGQRIPRIARWPGRIREGSVCSAMVTLGDWLPTFAGYAGARLPRRRIDGKDLGALLADGSGGSPHAASYFYYGPQLQAVRSGRWKLFLPLERRLVNLNGGTAPGDLALYDLAADIGETRDVAALHPEVVRRLTALAEGARSELGDVGRRGRGQRDAGRVDRPAPRLLPARRGGGYL